ncbi:hypothetical protein NDU88_002645 [Pleurodeles waltl]|uniref:Uncharacterized protein n=1 Tax=Pleurodeles waltl TaxID=8319 RepID=A0AAV7UXU5_PLEWA|nr:hypothetical protein NDU88_002645 [Pleurodeles waltl]
MRDVLQATSDGDSSDFQCRVIRRLAISMPKSKNQKGGGSRAGPAHCLGCPARAPASTQCRTEWGRRPALRSRHQAVGVCRLPLGVTEYLQLSVVAAQPGDNGVNSRSQCRKNRVTRVGPRCPLPSGGPPASSAFYTSPNGTQGGWGAASYFRPRMARFSLPYVFRSLSPDSLYLPLAPGTGACGLTFGALLAACTGGDAPCVGSSCAVLPLYGSKAEGGGEGGSPGHHLTPVCFPSLPPGKLTVACLQVLLRLDPGAAVPEAPSSVPHRVAQPIPSRRASPTSGDAPAPPTEGPTGNPALTGGGRTHQPPAPLHTAREPRAISAAPAVARGSRRGSTRAGLVRSGRASRSTSPPGNTSPAAGLRPTPPGELRSGPPVPLRPRPSTAGPSASRSISLLWGGFRGLPRQFH